MSAFVAGSAVVCQAMYRRCCFHSLYVAAAAAAAAAATAAAAAGVSAFLMQGAEPPPKRRRKGKAAAAAAAATAAGGSVQPHELSGAAVVPAELPRGLCAAWDAWEAWHAGPKTKASYDSLCRRIKECESAVALKLLAKRWRGPSSSCSRPLT